MKNLLLMLSIAALSYSCSSGPTFKDKVNENAYRSISMGMTYEEVLLKVGGLDGKKMSEDVAGNYVAYDWSDGDISNSTCHISVGFSDGKATDKSLRITDEKGQVIKSERYPE